MAFLEMVVAGAWCGKKKKKYSSDVWRDLAGFCVGINDLYLSSQKCHISGDVGWWIFSTSSSPRLEQSQTSLLWENIKAIYLLVAA